MRSHSHLNTARSILQAYDGSMPLAAWLKHFFKAEKKFGSSDRKQITQLCYCYYRLGNSFQQLPVDERLLLGLFLCSSSPNKVLLELRPEWNEKLGEPLDKKMKDLLMDADRVFPFAQELSAEIETLPFALSFLIQPDLFLRIRPGAEEKLPAQLEEAGVDYKRIDSHCIALHNQTKVDELLQLDRDAVVQDLNSQQVMSSLEKLLDPSQKLDVWDCCAASGGKSLLFHDLFPFADLTVSDIRESILINLQNRFKRAGISRYNHFIADLSSPHFLPKQKFDVIICDAPCSGSGTWSRTPEQLHFFRKEKIGHYTQLQKNIAVNASRSLKAGGYFLYITCSVFAAENEKLVAEIQDNTSLQLHSTTYYKGYGKKADTLFTALFRAS